ncbi:MAG: class I SAM-dependent methyltransferase [Candidatus Binataceae bacterium]
MNTSLGKQILAAAREADFAHAGEEEAIERALRSIPKDSTHKVLDVGCGRGGTADYVARNGWGRVTGIDRDPESILYAKRTYPSLEFHVADVSQLPLIVQPWFELIYMMNAFYAFDSQREALVQMRKVAAGSARLAIFDYADRGGLRDRPLLLDGAPILPNPIVPGEIERLVERGGWLVDTVEDVTDDYRRWYAALLERIDRKHDEIAAIGDEDAFSYVRSHYQAIHDAIADGKLGGVIILATAI